MYKKINIKNFVKPGWLFPCANAEISKLLDIVSKRIN